MSNFTERDFNRVEWSARHLLGKMTPNKRISNKQG
jgi:hypothetical protein